MTEPFRFTPPLILQNFFQWGKDFFFKSLFDDDDEGVDSVDDDDGNVDNNDDNLDDAKKSMLPAPIVSQIL